MSFPGIFHKKIESKSRRIEKLIVAQNASIEYNLMMSEQFKPLKPQSQEENSEQISKQERFQKLGFLFLCAENVFAIEGREAAKPLLPEIYDDLIALNKRDKEKDWDTLFIWNPDGDLSEEEFNLMNLRRKKLSNAIGIMTASGKVRHNLNEI